VDVTDGTAQRDEHVWQLLEQLEGFDDSQRGRRIARILFDLPPEDEPTGRDRRAESEDQGSPRGEVLRYGAGCENGR